MTWSWSNQEVRMTNDGIDGRELELHDKTKDTRLAKFSCKSQFDTKLVCQMDVKLFTVVVVFCQIRGTGGWYPRRRRIPWKKKRVNTYCITLLVKLHGGLNLNPNVFSATISSSQCAILTVNIHKISALVCYKLNSQSPNFLFHGSTCYFPSFSLHFDIF